MKFLSTMMLVMFTLSACSCAATIPNRVSYLEDLRTVSAMRDATAGLVDENGLYCAGAFISQNEVLTAAHCLSRPGHIELVQEDGHLFFRVVEPLLMTEANVVTRTEYMENAEDQTSNSGIFNVVFRDEEKDLVLLRADDPEYDFIHGTLNVPTSSTQDSLVIGTSVYAIGHPAGIGWNVSHGFISREPITDNNLQVVVSSSDIFFGNSGGPLTDGRGNLLGIAHAMPGAGGAAATYIGLFISPNEIMLFLDRAHSDNH